MFTTNSRLWPLPVFAAEGADGGAAATDETETDAETTDAATEGAQDGADGSTATDGATDKAGASTDAAGGDDKSDKTDKSDTTTLPENWRELAAGDDEDTLKLLKRYGSLSGVAKALKEKEALIRSGKMKRDMPDPKDEKAMAEWRKAEGIPDDPTGYELPEPVKKRMTDADKPLLSSFTEFAHKRGARPDAVNLATEWYVEMAEASQAQQIANDDKLHEEAEESLRKDWGPEFKANLSLAAQFLGNVPGVGKEWAEARLSDGRRLGDVPEFVAWASDMGRGEFGDPVFATADAAERHNSRKAEIEAVLKTDYNRYYKEGLDKEYAEILQKEEKRRA